MNRKRSITSRLYLMYGIAILPLIIFGLYKNGIRLYNKDYVDFIGMLKPAILILMSLCGIIIGNLIRVYKEKKSLSDISFSNFKNGILEALILSMTLPIKSSPIILFIVTIIFGIFFPKCKTNRIAFMYLIVQGLNALLGLNSFSNVYEASTVLNYDGVDLFFGFGSGGICSTSIILIVASLIFLSFNNLYKKNMAFSALISFMILVIIPNMISGNYNVIMPTIFGYNILFVFVFVLPNLYSSSYTSKGQILSGIVVGCLTYFIAILTPYNAAMISVFLVTPLKGVFDRLFVIK